MRIGVLGGGQLGRMLALEGIPLGNRFTFLEPSPDPPAAAVGTVISAPYDDLAALDRLADATDVVTYEFENVPAASAHHLAERVPVFPPPTALDTTQDRLAEKRLFEELGIPVAPYRALDTPTEVGDALDAVGLPAVIKTRRFGYDGKGQAVVRTAAEAERAATALGPGLIAESHIPFERELSVVGARGADGSRVCYPLTENHHSGGILRTSWAPAPALKRAVLRTAERYAALLMDRLEYVGVLAIELFENSDRLVANEIAPRVHNSGHWTLDGTQASQFENHIRAVSGLPLAAPRARAPTAMLNIIGEMPDVTALATLPGVHLHLYDKDPRPGRKLGHINVVGATRETLAAKVDQLERLLRLVDQSELSVTQRTVQSTQ